LESSGPPLIVGDTESVPVVEAREAPLILDVYFTPFPVYLYYMVRWT